MTKGQESPVAPKVVDKVRASRDGHAFHEAWAARTALELLPPDSELVAIAMEGFAVEDTDGAAPASVEVADLVRYYGGRTIERATRVEIVQFKYSIANAETPVRAADLAPTLLKFARADLDLRARHGDAATEEKVRYDYATNRPIHPNLRAAISTLLADKTATGDVARQARQLRESTGEEADLKSILHRLDLTGSRGSLAQADRQLREVLASWSEASDPEAEKRLLKLRSLVRDKAGSAGQDQNLIDRVAVLAELGVDHESQLYPTPDAFPPVDHVVPRTIVDDVITASAADALPLVVHGAGGMGKTVVMQAVAEKLAADHRIVLFDGFGAGRWRDPADGRHRPERTLVHIANLLAGQGLCDILLPVSDNVALVRAFRRRLEQAVGAARQASEQARIVLLLDAIDHAGIEAQATGTQSFAHLLLKSLSVTPIAGVSVIASCRPGERLALAVGDAAHREIQVPAFSPAEARQLILDRDPAASMAEIAALESRSERNPRVLDALLTAGRPYDGPRPGGDDSSDQEVLDALLLKRLADARETARSKGSTDADIDTLLSGLSILPPPVPSAELAAAHDLTIEEVEGFAADLAPLLERTPHGLMFRDEPTETLVRRISVGNPASRERVVDRLFARQDVSDYAARALPAVLTELGRADRLVNLAFDTRVPPGASKVSQRDIRLARIVAALQLCARDGRFDDLLRVLLEASLVAAGHERADRFLYEHPDLVAATGDSEAFRRLFATKAGWPGGRHAALALAYALAGNAGEARRNSRRAIDWHNWAVERDRPSGFDRGRASAEWDDIGFAYVEMRSGRTSYMTGWFAQRSDGALYAKLLDILDLLERHPDAESEDFAPRERLLGKLAHCRLQRRGLWAAALRYSTGDPAFDRRLIAGLAKSDKMDGDGPPASALLAATARAIQLGMRPDAEAILASAVKRPDVHDYSSYWPMDRDAEDAVIAAGLTAALRGRAPTLIDLAPVEFLALVPKSLQGRGPKAFLQALRDRFKPPSYPQKRRRKPHPHYRDFDGYDRALTHRILPLLPYANVIKGLVTARPDDLPARIAEALACLPAAVAGASEYPYRDGKAYIARIGFRSLFEIIDAIGALDGRTAGLMVSWLKTAPGLFAPQLTAVVTRLSRHPACHNAALELAAHVETLLVRDTDTASRIAAYGELARAVWRVSLADARAYFRRGLDLADAIGSDDFDRTNHLLELTGHYRGPPLDASAAHDLSRIFELNQHEVSKFPWIEYAQSMAPTAGLASLALASRMDDRDHAALGYSLAPLLTSLMAAGTLPADLAAAIVGLEEVVESWTFRIGRFVTAALQSLPPARYEWLFETMLVEIDRTDRLSPWRETVEELLKLAEAHLPAGSPSLQRLAGLVALREKPEPAATGQAVPQDEHLAEVALGDPDAIDRAIEADMAANDQTSWPERTLADLAKRPISPAERLAFVEAVALAGAASLAAKIGALEDHLADWSANSPGLRDALPGVAARLASKHASELVGNAWQSHHAWRRLTGLFGADRTILVAAVITSLAPAATELGGDSWLALAAQLAPSAGTAAFKQGLERFLGQAGATLPEEVGDGPWRVELTISDRPDEAVAGLLWMRLGNPQAASRWRAAHALRRLAALGRYDVIDLVAARFDASDAGPFGAPHLPFYAMHARLWLLIALARIAKSHRAEALRFRPLFERVAFDATFPHIVMRHFAAEGLRSLLACLPDKALALCRRLALVNASSLPAAEAKGDPDGRHAGRPEDRPEPENAFHLDYDFNKYQVSDLTHAFGAPEWEIEDAINRWVRGWDTDIRAMYDCPRISREDFSARSWSSGYLPDADRYGDYLGWHALMLVAGELLATRPISGESWKDDPWGDLIKDVILTRTDGLWLADLTDLVPLDLGRPLPMPEADGTPFSREDPLLLAPILGIEDGRLGDRLTVSGSWSLPGDVTVDIRSLLANRTDADAAMSAVLTDRKFSQWLPSTAHDVEREFGNGGDSVKTWLRRQDERDRALDRHDPYASPSAMSRMEPEEWVTDCLGVTAEDDSVRLWSRAGVQGVWSEAWGLTIERRDEQSEEAGSRMTIRADLLTRLLASSGTELLLFVKARQYFRGKKVPDKFGDTSSWSHRIVMLTVDAGGRVRFKRGIPRKARAAVDALPRRDRVDLRERFIVIRKTELNAS